jgi:hypothetical protein
VTASRLAALDVSTAATVETWLDDLFWHKKMYRGARWRWWGEHVTDLITTYTGGQLTFRSMDDLRQLQRYQQRAEDEAFTCQLALADPLQMAKDVMGIWNVVGAAVGLSEVECSTPVCFAETHPTQARTNHQVERVRRVVRRQPFKNPLIEALELKQLWRLHQAAAAMLEDTTCDLLVELRDSRPDVALCEAVGVLSSKGLDTRIAAARKARGGPGDPRRIPRQIY